jgi:hypothetical protein
MFRLGYVENLAKVGKMTIVQYDGQQNVGFDQGSLLRLLILVIFDDFR